MKKIFSLTVVLITAFIFSVSAFADESTSKDLTPTNLHPEKSIEEAYNDAINGISDIPVTELNLNSSIIKSNESNKSNESLDVKKYVTAQILSESKNEDSVEQQIVVTVFNDANINDTNNKIQSMGVQPMGDKGADGWDGSYGVQAYSRIYYTLSTKNGISFALLTKVTGGWNVQDTSISLSNRTVRYGSSGWPTGSQSDTQKPSGNSYTYNMPSSWAATSLTADYAIGTTSVVTLKRGGSTWSLELTNNL